MPVIEGGDDGEGVSQFTSSRKSLMVFLCTTAVAACLRARPPVSLPRCCDLALLIWLTAFFGDATS
jgi:hypothetical protein